MLRAIEAVLGRVRTADKNAPRPIDLDIALWGDRVIEDRAAGLVIPDPDILRWPHVAVPLADVAPDWVHPADGRTLAAIAAGLAAGGAGAWEGAACGSRQAPRGDEDGRSGRIPARRDDERRGVAGSGVSGADERAVKPFAMQTNLQLFRFLSLHIASHAHRHLVVLTGTALWVLPGQSLGQGDSGTLTERTLTPCLSFLLRA